MSWKKILRAIGRYRREASADLPATAFFRAGYFAAIHDIERTGLRPNRDDTIRRSADRALKRWIDEGDLK